MKPFLSKRIVVLGCILALLGVFIVPSIAYAGFGDQVFDMVMRIFASLMYLILYISAYLVSTLAKVLDFLVRFQLDGNLFVIVELWRIVRDFANMFFIVILIIMAFATIFDVGMLNIPGLGGIDGRKLIAQFIIVALLINFSLTIGTLVIGATNAVNNVFLASIGDISNRLGQSLNPSYTLLGIIPEKINTTNLRSTIPQASAELTTISHVVKMFFSIILTLIILFSLIIANFFALFRIPVIWMLLVFSPIAWLSSILPSTRKINQDWWAKFMGWNVYLPVFLFFLYFGLYFMSYQDRVIAGLAEGYTAKVVTGNDTFGDFALASLQTIFFYFIAAFTLIGGTSFAVKAASGGGKALENVVGWGKGFAEGLPVFSSYRAARDASKEQLEQIKKEGLGSQFSRPSFQKLGDMVYGGKAGQERDTRRWRERLYGVPGGLDAGAYKGKKEEVTAIDKRIGELKTLETAGKLNINDPKFEAQTYAMPASSTEGAARRSLLYERGKIKGTEFAKDMDLLTKTNPFLAEALSEKASKGKYRNVKGDQLLDMASGEGAYTAFADRASAATSRRLWFNAIKDNDDALKVMKAGQLETAVELMGGKDSNEGKEFLKTIGNKRPDLVGEYKGKGSKFGTLREAFKAIDKKKPSEIADMLDATWENPLFQNALKIKISILNKKKPAVPGGVYIPAGVTPPATALAPGATWPLPGGIPTTGGTIYDFKLFKAKEVGSIPGAFKAKAVDAGGTKFKDELLKSVGTSSKKLKIAAAL